MATALSLIQRACYSAGISAPSAIVGATDTSTLQIRELFYDTALELRRSKFWTQLKRTYTFTLSAGKQFYQLPQDFYAALPLAYWDRARNWELDGPKNDNAFDYRLYGIGVSQVRRAYRVFGMDMNPSSGGGQFQISPVPGAGDDGARITLEYISKTWVLPPHWVASGTVSATASANCGGNIYTHSAGTTNGTVPPNMAYGEGQDGAVFWKVFTPTAWGTSTVYAPGDYVTNGGNVYLCTVAGTSASSGGPTGTTISTDITDGTVTWRYLAVSTWEGSKTFAVGDIVKPASTYYRATTGGITGKVTPTWTATTVSDGTITWTFQLTPQESLVTDSDLVLFDDEPMMMGLKWRFMRAKGLNYQDIKEEYDDAIEMAEARWAGARIFDLAGGGRNVRYGVTVPEGNWGF